MTSPLTNRWRAICEDVRRLPFLPMLGTIMICLVGCVPGSAEEWDPTISQYQHTAWGEKEGAPGVVRALAQTQDGFLWLGTPHGLYQFDGVTFEPFEPPSWSAFPTLHVYSLLALPDGSLWVGFAVGAVSVLRNGIVTNYTRADGLPAGTVVSLARDGQGTMWAATTAGLARLEGNRWKTVGKDWNFPGTIAYKILVDSHGTLWVATENTIVFLPAGSTQFQPTGVHVGQVWQIAEAPNGKLWMAETTRSVRPVPLNAQQMPADDTEIKVGSVSILFDQDGALWITTLGDGLRRAATPQRLHGKIAEFSTAVQRFTAKDGLSGDSVKTILEDREGNIWLGTDKGLDQFRKTNLTPIALSFPANQIVMAAGDNDDVWIFSEGHAARWHNGRAYDIKAIELFGAEQARHRSPDTIAGAYRCRDGTVLWIGMSGIYRDVNGRPVSLPLPKELATPYSKPFRVTEDHSHILWAAAGPDGIFRLSGGKWTKLSLGLPIAQSHSTAAYTDWMGRLWFGYEDGTITILNASKIERIFVPQETTVGSMRAIDGSNGHVWVGGDLGLALFIRGGFHRVAPADAAKFRTVWGMVETAGGDLWLCESRGVIHISSTEVGILLNDPDHHVKYELFDSFDGLPGTFPDAAEWSRAIQGSDGTIWFAASNGIARTDPAKIIRNVLPPPVAIRSLSADGKQYPFGNNTELPPLTRNLHIQFTALSLSIPQRVRFRYRLEGLDKEWQDAGARRDAWYTNLSPGKYHFHVIASNNDGVWNNSGAALSFAVAPAFDQTTWFKALCILVPAGAVWALYWLRLRQATVRLQQRLGAQMEERERIAHELHDTLLQSFQGLIFRLQAVNDLLLEGKAKHQLEQALQRADEAMGEGRSAVYDLRSSASTTNDLAQAIKALGVELATNVSASFHVVVEGAARDLQPIVRDEIYRIAREALRNAFNHAHANHIETEITYGEPLFRLRIRDDGEGIPTKILEEGRSGHYGLAGMRERAKQIGGELEIWSQAKAGTEIELSVAGSVAYGASTGRSLFRLFRQKAG